jgi:galactitol-specific phosphotransferase system IIC component
LNDLNGIVRPVTPEEFSNTLAKLFVTLLQVVQNFIKPIAGLGIMIAVLLLLIGYIFHVQTAKKMGASILGGVGFVVIIYLLAPYILGIIYNTFGK